MTTINKSNYQILRENGYVVTNKDMIIFEPEGYLYKYAVHSAWITACEMLPETVVLQRMILDKIIPGTLSQETIIHFCESCYGYKSKYSGSDIDVWPECHTCDYLALTNLIYTIFDLLENNRNPIKEIKLSSLTKISFLTC